MRVEKIMTAKVFTLDQQDMIDRAYFLIHYEGIRHLPVVEKGKVIGIVSDRDMYKALGPKSNSRIIEAADGKHNTELHVIPKRVGQIMRRGVITVTHDSFASEAAAIMADKKIGALPVVDKDGKLVGIITSTDILKVFAKIESVNEEQEKKSLSASDAKKESKKPAHPKHAR